MPNLWRKLFNRKPEAPAAEPTNDEMALDMARYDALLELGYFDDENSLTTEQREAISEALDEKFEELRDQPENAGRSGEDLYIQAGKSITERRDTVRQQDWPGLSLGHSNAIAEAERILGFASLTEEQRDRFSGLLDDRREFLIGQGVDQVKAWTVAAQEIKRVWPELRDAPSLSDELKQIPAETQREWSVGLDIGAHEADSLSEAELRTYNKTLGILAKHLGREAELPEQADIRQIKNEVYAQSRSRSR